jgi:hypothetical protein
MVAGPAIGGYIGTVYGPDKAFILSGVFYAAVMAIIAAKLPETLEVNIFLLLSYHCKWFLYPCFLIRWVYLLP